MRLNNIKSQSTYTMSNIYSGFCIETPQSFMIYMNSFLLRKEDKSVIYDCTFPILKV